MIKFDYWRNPIPIPITICYSRNQREKKKKGSKGKEENLLVERAAGLNEAIGIEFIGLEDTESLLHLDAVLLRRRCRRRRASLPSHLRRRHFLIPKQSLSLSLSLSQFHKKYQIEDQQQYLQKKWILDPRVKLEFHTI